VLPKDVVREVVCGRLHDDGVARAGERARQMIEDLRDARDDEVGTMGLARTVPAFRHVGQEVDERSRTAISPVGQCACPISRNGRSRGLGHHLWQHEIVVEVSGPQVDGVLEPVTLDY
jgi:hypothetical protein